MSALALGYSWRDQYGRVARSSIIVDNLLDTDADMEALRALLQACSDASIDEMWQEHEYTRTGGDLVAASNTTMSVKDTVTLVFISSVGKLVRSTIVKPALAILLDDEVVDKAHALITEIKAKALLYLKDNAGNPIVDLIEGYRNRNKKKVK
jgi:hypothetical protein